MEIIVDDRERAVVPFLEHYANKTTIPFKIQRNEVGDYAITYQGYILMIIERKTWVDLAASFRDGRKNNVQKLIELRNRTGCQIAYLIEGPATPSLTQLFGRIPVRALRAHLDHLAIRDGIHVLYSKDEDYTAMRLFELSCNYLSLKEIIKNIDDNIAGGTEQDNTDELQSDMGIEKNINEQLLQCLPGVGSLLSTVLAEKGITIMGLYLQKYKISEIANLKYASGASVGIEKGKKLVEGVKKLIESQSKTALKIQIRLLSVVPLISKKTAEIILQHTSLSLIFNGSVDEVLLGNIEKSPKTKVGLKAARNILEYFDVSNLNTSTTDVELIIQTPKKKPILANRVKKE